MEEHRENVFGSPGLRLVQILTLLRSSSRSYSLTRLANLFRCSRQTVLRMVEQLQRIRDIEIESWREGRERWFRGKTARNAPNVNLDIEAIRHLMLCRDIVRHVLPKPLQDEIRETIGAASVLLADSPNAPPGPDSFADPLGKGVIDYTPHQRHIDAIQTAMHDKRLCSVVYGGRGSAPKSYLVAPVRILCFREALYLRCMVCDKSGSPCEDAFRTFAIHRIRKLQLLKQRFGALPEIPESGAFGFPFHAPIQVCVAFSPAVADYVAERQWSKNQRIRKRKSGGITLTFTTTSRQEVLSWVLGFGKEAELLEPKDLRRELQAILREMARIYGAE